MSVQKIVGVSCDPVKRERALAERGVDFAIAPGLFAGRTLTPADERFDYGEPRLKTDGFLEGRVVMVVWTPRGDVRQVILMRHCHERESRSVLDRLD